MAATVRVFLCTYRRNNLLPRALKSLLSQTFQDWVCELHNDDPNDPFPARLVAEVNDPRVSIVNHSANLGPTRTFNLFFREGIEETYFSILEDDNWWEPEFLAVMIRELHAASDCDIAWANMRLWQEDDKGEWKDTEKVVWEHQAGQTSKRCHWPDLRQARGALHSNGFMLARSKNAERHHLPQETPFAAIEPVRERTFDFPILFVPDILGNFAITISTARGNSRLIWAKCQVLLVTSFFCHVKLDDEYLRKVISDARKDHPPWTSTLIYAGFIDRRCRHILSRMGLIDWLRFAKNFVRSPVGNCRLFWSKSAMPEMWRTLDEATARSEARKRHGPGLCVNFQPIESVESK